MCAADPRGSAKPVTLISRFELLAGLRQRDPLTMHAVPEPAARRCTDDCTERTASGRAEQQPTGEA